MGAITRAAANNITTGGVILPAGINDASVASIDALAQVSAGDGITLISAQTASFSSRISFTTGIDSTYRTYLFKFINCHPTNDNVNFEVNFSTDGGVNWNATKTTTNFQAYQNEGGSATSLAYDSGRDLAQSTGYQKLGYSTGNDNDQCISGWLYLFSPSSTTYVKHFISNVNNYYYDNYSINSIIAGYCNTTSAINAVTFQFNSGDIDDGKILMYGIA